MDNIERIINYLQAVVSTGEIANDMQRELVETSGQLFEQPEFEEAFGPNVEKFVNSVLVPMAFEIYAQMEGEDEDRLQAVGDALGSAFATGLAAGISIGILAGAD